jgi:hypothetical protein
MATGKAEGILNLIGCSTSGAVALRRNHFPGSLKRDTFLVASEYALEFP